MAEWWQEKALAELSPGQWEALCDGCAKCCLHKLEDEEDGEVFTPTGSLPPPRREDYCRCSDYPNRSVMVPNCIRRNRAVCTSSTGCPVPVPIACGRGEPLADWHPW